MLAVRNAARAADLNRRIILNPWGLEELGAVNFMQLDSMALEVIRDQLPLLPAPPLRYHTPAELQLQCAHGDKLDCSVEFGHAYSKIEIIIVTPTSRGVQHCLPKEGRGLCPG